MTLQANLEPKIIVLDNALSLSDACQIANGRCSLRLSDAALERCDESHGRLRLAIDESRHIYGLTTGFGPLANRLVSPEQGADLQQNLVYHLATGLGHHLAWSQSRAIVLARLMSILQGYSGASRASINALVTLLNSEFSPCLPERGTVGASGDLTPLAHMVLSLQGRNGFLHRDGAQVDGASALSAMGIAPLSLTSRDGLALVNGTSAMTGISVLTVDHATRLVQWATGLTAVLAEVMRARTEAWSPLFAKVRPHAGQTRVTDALLGFLAGSDAVQSRPISHRTLSDGEFVTEQSAGQDAYTLRCAPQVIGAVADALIWHNAIVETELHSVTDNPLFPKDGDVAALHGGNFMGQHIALVSDTLSAAVTVLGGLVERQIARLTDEKLNNGLPAFLNRAEGGLHSGFMGAQVSATATLAEMRAHTAFSVQSISTNGANQDVVSMGTSAARRASTTCELCADILSILALSVVQAIEIKSARENLTFSRNALAIHKAVRKLSPELTEDRPLSNDVRAVSNLVLNGDYPASSSSSRVDLRTIFRS